MFSERYFEMVREIQRNKKLIDENNRMLGFDGNENG